MKKLFFLLLVSLFSINCNFANVTPDQIEYWVGSGENSAVATFYFCREGDPISIAYGYRWSGTATIEDMLIALRDTDDRFNYTFTTWITGISYTDDDYTLEITDGMLMYTVNGNFADGVTDELHDGDYFELQEWSMDCDDYEDAEVIIVSNPNTGGELPEDATIDINDIVYWVGNGDSKVVFAVNWNNPDVALAWGVRFDNDSALVADLMNTLRIYDERFGYTSAGTFVTDITFSDATRSYALTGQWWMYNVNGTGAMNGIDAQYVFDGDIVKFGDESCGTADENYNYAWATPIAPVELPADTMRTFDGIVGTEGCQALHFENAAILGWASSCTIERGPQDIANGSVLASYGDESVATGPSSLSTTDAVSLGDGGIATLTFDMPISNGEGYDFAVFENSLNDVFLELAFVEVSSDGEHFYRFPSVCSTPNDEQIGNAGELDATHLYNLAGKYSVGYGTPFDLEELAGYSNLDIDNITHVRIVDAIGSIDPQYATRDRNGRIINDPYPTAFASCGFDLTGVAVLNGWIPDGIDGYTANSTSLTAFPNPCQSLINISTTANDLVSLYNAQGMLVASQVANGGQTTFNMSSLSDGIYFVKSGNTTVKIVKIR